MAYLPAGRMSARTGTLAPIRVKSSMESGMPAACAIASRWSTAFVEPSRAMVTVIAFSKASRLKISEGLMPRSISRTTASPAARQSFRFWSDTASWADELGSDKPRASMADAMVFAVYMPPQEPGPGIDVASMSLSAISDKFPAAYWPTASKTETTSRRSLPG